MPFQLTTLPSSNPAQVADELRRFITNVGEFGLQMVVVQPPYAKRPLQVWLLDVPDAVAGWVNDRLFPIILGPTGPLTRTGAVAPRAEWTEHALLLPTASAQALDPLLLRDWTSAHLQCRWTPGRCGGLLHYSQADTPRLDQIRALGWRVVALTPLVTRMLRTPLVTGRSSILPVLTSHVSLPAPAPVSAPGTAPTLALTAETSQLTQPLLEPLPSVLAGPGEPGLLLGVTPQDVGIKLAWRAHACAIDAPVPRQRAAFLALLRRAFAQGMGVVAIVPRGLLSENALQPWADRLRVLDGERNPIESAAIPWPDLSPAALADVLARLDITTPLPDPLPTEFGALLRQLDAADLCTQAVLIATARPGDDLLGVAAQGGGVVLVDTDDAGSDLLGSLLVQLFAERMRGDRPLLLVRPARLPVPAALAERCLQIVLGRSASAVATLTAQPGQWLLTDAQGEIVLDTDLTRTPSEIAEGDHAALVTTLTGGDGAAPLPILPSESVRDLVPLAAQAHVEVPAAPERPAVLLSAAQAVELMEIPALLSTEPAATPVAHALPAAGMDQPVAEPVAPEPEDAVVVEDWATSLGDTIAEIDPEVTDPAAFTPRIVPLPAAPAPSSDAADTFDWWEVTDDVRGTLDGTSAVATNDTALGATTPSDQPHPTTPTLAPTPVSIDQVLLPSREPPTGAAADAHARELSDDRQGHTPQVSTEAAMDAVPTAAAEQVPSLELPSAALVDAHARELSDAPHGQPPLVAADVAVDVTPLPELELPALTLAPLEEWDVRLDPDDQGAVTDELLLADAARVTGDDDAVAPGGLPVTAAEQVLGIPSYQPLSKHALRPPRRRWTPGQSGQRAQAVLAAPSPDQAAQDAPAMLASVSEPIIGPVHVGDHLAVVRSLPAQIVGETQDASSTAHDLTTAASSDHMDLPLLWPNIDLPLPDPAQDEVLLDVLMTVLAAGGALAETTDQAAQEVGDRAAEGHQEDADDGAGQGSDAYEAVPLHLVTAPPTVEDLRGELGSTQVPGAAAAAALSDLLPVPDSIAPPTAHPWSDIDRDALIGRWRGGLSMPDLVRQLQAEYPQIDAAAIRAVVRPIIQAALAAPVGSPPPVAMEQPTPPVQEGRPAPTTSAAPLGSGGLDTPTSDDRGPAVPVPEVAMVQVADDRAVDDPADDGALLSSPPIGTLTTTATDDQIWAAWLAGVGLNDMIRELSGLTPRSLPGQATRDRIHQVVVPRIVADLGVEALVGRWIAQEPLRDDDREPFELLLQRMNRQSHPVTGPIRVKTEQRLRAVMQPLVDACIPVAEG